MKEYFDLKTSADQSLNLVEKAMKMNNKGFTMIECIVLCLLILVVVLVGRSCCCKHQNKESAAVTVSVSQNFSTPPVAPVSRTPKDCDIKLIGSQRDAARVKLACQTVVDSGKVGRKQKVNVRIHHQPDGQVLCTITVGENSASALSADPDLAVSRAIHQMLFQLK